MLRKIFNGLILLPLAIVLVVFAVANRHAVSVSLDPFNASDPALTLTAPLFVVMLLSAIAGVVAGGIFTWIGQRGWRKAARRHEADARQAHRELDAQKAAQSAPAASPNAMLRLPVR